MSECEHCGEYNCDNTCYSVWDDYDDYDDNYISPWEEFLDLVSLFLKNQILEEEFIRQSNYLGIDNFEIVKVIQAKRDKQLKTL